MAFVSPATHFPARAFIVCTFGAEEERTFFRLFARCSHSFLSLFLSFSLSVRLPASSHTHTEPTLALSFRHSPCSHRHLVFSSSSSSFIIHFPTLFHVLFIRYSACVCVCSPAASAFQVRKLLLFVFLVYIDSHIPKYSENHWVFSPPPLPFDHQSFSCPVVGIARFSAHFCMHACVCVSPVELSFFLCRCVFLVRFVTLCLLFGQISADCHSQARKFTACRHLAVRPCNSFKM